MTGFVSRTYRTPCPLCVCGKNNYGGHKRRTEIMDLNQNLKTTTVLKVANMRKHIEVWHDWNQHVIQLFGRRKFVLLFFHN